MKRVLIGVMLALVGANAVGAQTQKPKPGPGTASAEALAEVRRAIDKGNAQWVEGWEKGDPTMTAALFAEDGVQLARNGKLVKGRQQILERQRAGMQSVGKGVKVTVTTVDVWLDGDKAYETGKYSYKYEEKGQPVTEEGRYVTIWKRQKNGSWKLIMDMGVPQD
jgi:uncharacterized protein (TIGR02246 family)